MRFQRVLIVFAQPSWWREFEPWSDGRPDYDRMCLQSWRLDRAAQMVRALCAP